MGFHVVLRKSNIRNDSGLSFQECTEGLACAYCKIRRSE